MSSSNLVSLIMLKEADYGKTPDLAAATALQMRYTSEGLSGSPSTTERAEIRPDRMPSGQLVTGSEIGGDVAAELAKDATFDGLIEAAAMGTWTTPADAAMTGMTVAQDAANPKLYTFTATAGTFPTGNPGLILQVSGYSGADAVFNTVYSLSVRTSDTEISVYGPENLGDTTAGAAVTVAIPSFVEIGSTVHSYTLAKAYRDVEGTVPTSYVGQSYPGSLVSTLALTATYGEVAGATFTMVSNGYSQDDPSLEQQIDTAGGTITPAGTTEALSPTLDSGLVLIDAVPQDFCVQSVTMTLENNLDPKTCIGRVTPTNYTVGKASLGVELAIYNNKAAYDLFMARKWNLAPVDLIVSLVNADGGYVIRLRAVQLSFADPASTGENSQVMFELTGTGKVGAGGVNAARIYRIAP